MAQRLRPFRYGSPSNNVSLLLTKEDVLCVVAFIDLNDILVPS